MNKNLKKSAVLCFKRWSRNSWSVFASFQKVVKIGVLCVGMSILTLPFNLMLAQGKIQDTTIRAEKLKELKVVAQRANPTRGMSSPVRLYSRKQMVNLPFQTIENALKVNPSVDLRERGGRGVQADISLLGGNADQTMVMLNGVNFTDAQTGHQSHALPIDIEGISEISLIGGIPGIGAYSGAVNINTAPLAPNFIRAELSGGQYGYLYNSLSGAIQKDGLTAMVLGSLKKSDGYIENTDFDRTNLFTYITYDAANAGQFYFQAGYQKKYFGANSFYSLAYPNQAEQTKTYLTSLKWKKNIVKNLSLNALLSYRKNYDRFELFRGGDEAASWYTGHNYHMTDNVGAGLNLDYNWFVGTTSLGVDYTYNHIFSNVLGETLDRKVAIPGELNKFYTKAIDRNVVNGWLRHGVKLNDLDLSGSLNYASSSYGGSFLWSLGAGYQLNKKLKLDASAARSMRLPTFTDLYYTTATHTGNAALNPEKAITYKVGLTYNGLERLSNNALKGFKGHVSTYYRMGENIIDWVKEDEASKWESRQITTLNTLGVELSLGYSFDTFLKEISMSYGHIQTDKSSGSYISQYALDYLKDKFSASMELEIVESLTLGVVGSWYARNGGFLDAAGKNVAYPPYWMLDARLNWNLGKLDLYVDASNILDTKAYDFGGLLQAGRWFVAGLTITIGKF